MINLYISFDGLSYTIPVNPKELTISQSASNSNIDIIGLGKATRKGEPGLRTVRIKSFFPNPKSRYYYNIPALTYIEFIEKIWNTENINNKVADIKSYGISKDIQGKELDMYFVIEKFDYTYKGGDFDTEYSLSIKEYKPYGVKNVTEQFSEGMKQARAASTVNDNIPGITQDTQPTTEAKTYKIVAGDTLWTIAKRCTGDGSNWKILYDLNKDVIGSNANYLRQGITLTLPENWNSPTAKVNTSTTAKMKQQSQQTKTTLNNSTASKEIDTQKEVSSKKGLTAREQVDSAALSAFSEYNLVYKDNKYEFEHLQKDYSDTFSKDKSANSAYKKHLQNYEQADKILHDSSKSSEEKVKALQDLKQSEIAIAQRISSFEFWRLPMADTIQGKYYTKYNK